MDVDDIGLGIEMIFPDIFQQHGAGDNLARMAHQIFQQPEFARLKLDGRAVALGGAREQIELQIAHRDFRLHRARIAPANERVQPRQQLGEGIGLGEIIVAPCPQTFDAVIHIGERAQEEHRSHAALFAHFGHELETVELGKHAIHDRDIVRAGQRKRQSGFAVARIIDDMAGLFQALDQIALGFEIVLHHKNPHEQHSFLARSRAPRIAEKETHQRRNGEENFRRRREKRTAAGFKARRR